MGLPWVRLDSNINQHDKVLSLLGDRDGYRALTVYVFGLGWSGGQGTDGFIPRGALPVLHGQDRHARLLVDHRLWEYAEGGWRIRNWAERQETTGVSEAKRLASQKANCVRHHGPDCGCWRTK